jgi:hypothetical protein
MPIKRASEKTARAIAAILTVASPVSAAFPAAAQQMGLGADFSQCDKIKDPAKSAQCVYDTDIAQSKARIAAANARGAAADIRIAAADAKISESDALRRCIAFLTAKKAEGVVLAPERLNREKGCGYAAELGMK